MSAGRASRALALVAGLGLALAACSDGSSSSPGADPVPTTEAATTTTTTAPPPMDPATVREWERIEGDLAGLGPDVALLAARVEEGTCVPVRAVAPTSVHPIASQFKLFVLGALAEEIAAGRIAWDDEVTVEEVDRSFGNGEGTGSLQFLPDGTSVPVEEAATKMISISDNTATDVLIDLVGRDAVEDRAREWMADASATVPFLTTKEMFRLHYVPGLADRYLATPPDERHTFLAESVDPLPMDAIFEGITPEPAHVDTIEWFATPEDVCRALAGLQGLEADPALAPLDAVLSREDAGIDLEPEAWPTVWYKGGSEPGVLTLGWLATTAGGDTFVVEAMVTDPEAVLAPDAITDLVALCRDAFALLAEA